MYWRRSRVVPHLASDASERVISFRRSGYSTSITVPSAVRVSYLWLSTKSTTVSKEYGSTAVNGVWVLPGTHKQGKLDIKALVAESGSERLEGAVPIVCNPGDVVICNRQLLHGSFPNCGFEPRITVNFGFHKRSSVLGVMGGGIHSDAQVFDEEIVARRSRAIGYAIDARKQRFPDETPYQYQPLTAAANDYRWNDAARADLKDYNLDDLSI